MARVRRALHGDRGASAVELAVFAFVLLLVSMGIIQFALWFDARHAALAAAADGDRVARDSAATNGSWMTMASQEAMRYYRSLNTGVLDNVQPLVVPQGSTVSVTISGTLNGIIRLHISETVTGPIECFRTQQTQGKACAPVGG
ncbi:MAG TPA: TadE family protein [Streptosporangiaceae bacterium]